MALIIELFVIKGVSQMEYCPLYYNHKTLFSSEVICEATDEDLSDEQELLEQYCYRQYKKCLRFQTYHDLRIEYLVRKKLQSLYNN